MPTKDKGMEGSKTGKRTRDAIKSKQSQGWTLEEIGQRVSRSASTLSSILSGEIKNPPSNLAPQISKLPSKKKSGGRKKSAKRKRTMRR